MAKEDNIGKLFKEKLGNLTVQEDDLSWLTIESGLNRKAFFQFRPTRFNVFYAAIITGTFLISASMGIHYIGTNAAAPVYRIDTVYLSPVNNMATSKKDVATARSEKKDAPLNNKTKNTSLHASIQEEDTLALKQKPVEKPIISASDTLKSIKATNISSQKQLTSRKKWWL
ncbi:MAG: hypothetical protein HC896_09650 [Bacteroidales bacterium]|nr:hypothetical protein [Bacteroidales bacterium]